MTPIQMAEKLSQGETLSRQTIRGKELKVIECLKVIKTNCSKVTKQLKEW